MKIRAQTVIRNFESSDESSVVDVVVVVVVSSKNI